jgi:chemotaxis protein CheD
MARAGIASTAAGPRDDGRPRLRNTRSGMHSVRLQPGECYTTGDPGQTIVTVLGSCVAACVRDPRTGFGGMNHFMLAESDSGEWNGVSAAMRYGNYAMEALINAVLKSGCCRRDLEIKLFGASNLSIGSSMVAEHNANFALRYLEAEGLALAAHDLGGARGRRIHYLPATGKVQRLFLQRTKEVVEDEQRYVAKLKTTQVEGSIDLF